MLRRATLGLLLALAVGPYLIDLGGSSIWDANEAFYVETPREMMERGDYVVPSFNYEPRLNKPVLSYWIVAAFYQAFGISVGVQRIPIAIGGLVLIATAFLLARAAYPDRDGRGAVTAGLWAAIGLAVSPRLVMFARRIFIDIYISVFMALTLVFFALAERYPARRRQFLVLMYVAVGLGALTKGPIAVVLPGLAFFLYLLVHRELGRIREMLIPTGVLIVSAILAPWYIALYRREGWSAIASFILGENVARYTDGVGVNAERGPLFYLPVVFSDAFPWSLLLLAAGIAWFADRRRADPARRVETLLWLWIAAIVGFFTLSAAKQDLYIFPIVPAVAALGAVALVRACSSDTSGRLTTVVRWTAVLAGALLLIAGGLLTYLWLSVSPPAEAAWSAAQAVRSLSGMLMVGIVALGCGAVATGLALTRRIAPAMLVVAAALATANWLFVVRVLPSFEVYKPSPEFARLLADRTTADDAVATFNVALPSLVFYLRRHIDVAYDPAPILTLLESDRRTFVVLSSRDYDLIQRESRAPTCVVASKQTFDLKLKNVMAGEQLPVLLVITNRCAR